MSLTNFGGAQPSQSAQNVSQPGIEELRRKRAELHAQMFAIVLSPHLANDSPLYNKAYADLLKTQIIELDNQIYRCQNPAISDVNLARGPGTTILAG